ncbi:MAG: hypothetical protein ACTHU0_28440 [Kofleriaceae bacterium]
MDSKLAPIQIVLRNRDEDVETPWAYDLGPADGPEGSRRVRLVNVPFLHAKPTWGDVIVVSPDEDGALTWDANRIAWSKIDTRIEEDGGRYAMIVDYEPVGVSAEAAFDAIHDACADQELVCEDAFEPREDAPGRAYLAVPNEISPDEVMKLLAEADLPTRVTQFHPAPPKRSAAKRATAKKAPAKKAPTKQAAAKKASTKKPTAKKATPTKAPAKKTPAKKAPKPAAKKSPAKKAPKPATKKPPAKKAAAKAPAKKATAKPAAKKPPAKKPPAKKSSARR